MEPRITGCWLSFGRFRGPIPISPSPHLGFKEKAVHGFQGFQEGRGDLHRRHCRDDCACAHPDSRHHFYGPNDGASSFSVVAAHSRALQVARSLTHTPHSFSRSLAFPPLLLLLLLLFSSQSLFNLSSSSSSTRIVDFVPCRHAIVDRWALLLLMQGEPRTGSTSRTIAQLQDRPLSKPCPVPIPTPPTTATNGISHSFILSTGDGNKGARDLLPGVCCRDKRKERKGRKKETKEVRQQASKGNTIACKQAAKKRVGFDSQHHTGRTTVGDDSGYVVRLLPATQPFDTTTTTTTRITLALFSAHSALQIGNSH